MEWNSQCFKSSTHSRNHFQNTEKTHIITVNSVSGSIVPTDRKDWVKSRKQAKRHNLKFIRIIIAITILIVIIIIIIYIGISMCRQYCRRRHHHHRHTKFPVPTIPVGITVSHGTVFFSFFFWCLETFLTCFIHVLLYLHIKLQYHHNNNEARHVRTSISVGVGLSINYPSAAGVSSATIRNWCLCIGQHHNRTTKTLHSAIPVQKKTLAIDWAERQFQKNDEEKTRRKFQFIITFHSTLLLVRSAVRPSYVKRWIIKVGSKRAKRKMVRKIK